MVKDSIAQNNMAREAVGNAGLFFGKALEQARTLLKAAVEVARPAVAAIDKISREHADGTTVGIGLTLLCLGMCGVWLKILFSIGV